MKRAKRQKGRQPYGPTCQFNINNITDSAWLNIGICILACYQIYRERDREGAIADRQYPILSAKSKKKEYINRKSVRPLAIFGEYPRLSFLCYFEVVTNWYLSQFLKDQKLSPHYGPSMSCGEWFIRSNSFSRFVQYYFYTYISVLYIYTYNL